MRKINRILIVGIVFIMCLLYAKVVFAGRSFLDIDIGEYDEYTGSETYNNKDEELKKSIIEPSPSINDMNFEQLQEFTEKAERLLTKANKVTENYRIISSINGKITEAGQRINSYFNKSFKSIDQKYYTNYAEYSASVKRQLEKSILEPEPSINNMTEQELKEYDKKARILQSKVTDDDIFRQIESKISQAGQTEGKKEEQEEPESVTGNSALGLPSLNETYRPQVENGRAIDMFGIILNVLTVLGVIILVVAIAFMGLGSILGSASGKAEYQHKFAGIVIAAGIMIGGSAIAKLIISVAESI